jgi:hypothetical protein
MGQQQALQGGLEAVRGAQALRGGARLPQSGVVAGGLQRLLARGAVVVALSQAQGAAQRPHLARRRRPLQQRQHAHEGVDARRQGRPRLAAQAVGQRERRRGAAEHRVDQRRGGVELGQQHQHVAELQARVAGEQVEQAVVQHLELAAQRMAAVQLQAAVARTQRTLGHGAEVEQAALHLGQQGGPQGFAVVAAIGMQLECGELAQQLLAGRRPMRQQRVQGLVAGVGPSQRLQACQPARAQQVEPVFAAGVEHVEVDVARFAQGGERLQVQRRQAGRGEQVHGAAAGRRTQARQLARQAVGAVVAHGAPERRHPGLVGVREQQPAFAPGGQPVRALQAQSFEPGGDRHGALPAQALGGRRRRVAQAVRQARVFAQQPGVGQQLVDAPGPGCGVQRLGLAALAQLLHQPGREVMEVELGGNAALLGQAPGQPALQRGAGDDQDLVVERPGRRRCQLLAERVEEGFELVGEVGLQAHGGRQCAGALRPGRPGPAILRAAGSARPPLRRPRAAGT